MTDTRPILRAVLLGALAAGVVACGRGEEVPAPTTDPAPPATGAGTEREVGRMPIDSPTMQRHAQQLDSTIADMHRHVQAMQQVSPEQWQARMGEHASRVARMLSLVDRQLREGEVGTRASTEEHGQMIQQMQALRTETEELQAASPAEVRRRMPHHLTRIQHFLLLLEQGTEHMRPHR